MQVSDDRLKWKTGEKTLVAHTPVFDVYTQPEESATGIKGNYIAVDAPDWVMTIPVIGDKFLLVKQWRHAEERLTVEFPGGVADREENPAVTAERELLEETGYKAGRLTKLGIVSPNPALFMNHLHVFLAEELDYTGKQNLDEDELLEYMTMPIKDVINDYGNEEYTHALMGVALALYMRHTLGDKL